MSRHVTNAGAFHAYVTQGISRPAGVGVSLVALMSYNLMQVCICGLFGFSVSSLLSERFGATFRGGFPSSSASPSWPSWA